MTELRDQLRTYRVLPGRMDDFVREFEEQLVPIRRQYGFEVVAAWVAEDDEFTWVVRYTGPGPFEEAEATYYGSPERTALDQATSAVRHLDSSGGAHRIRMGRQVL